MLAMFEDGEWYNATVVKDITLSISQTLMCESKVSCVSSIAA